jgi:hypothetical protein
MVGLAMAATGRRRATARLRRLIKFMARIGVRPPDRDTLFHGDGDAV